jgi:hypothetical protein
VEEAVEVERLVGCGVYTSLLDCLMKIKMAFSGLLNAGMLE